MTATLPPRHKAVAGRVRALMAEKQLNQADLAKAIGVAGTNASQRYRGLRPYSIDELGVIAALLDVRIEDLFAAPLSGGVERRVNSGWRNRRVSRPQIIPSIALVLDEAA